MKNTNCFSLVVSKNNTIDLIRLIGNDISEFYPYLQESKIDVLAVCEANSFTEADEKVLDEYCKSLSPSDRICKDYYNLDTVEILNSIKSYRSLDLRKVQDEEMVTLIDKITPLRLVLTTRYNAGDTFFRIRKVEDDLLFRNESDIWCAPDDKVGMGRVNKKNSPVLYVSNQIAVLFEEVRLKKDDKFALIRYKVKPNEHIDLANVGKNENNFQLHPSVLKFYDKSSWPIKSIINFEIINEFLVNEFTRDVQKGLEYLYRSSNLIAERVFFSKEIDGYEYPSIANKRGENIVLFKDSVKKLSFESIEYFSYSGHNKWESFNVLDYNIKSNKIVDSRIIYDVK